MTKAQKRALLWLPSDGTWIAATRDIAAAVGSLQLYHNKLVEAKTGWELKKSPRDRLYYRLTLEGQAQAAKDKAA